MKYQIPCSRLSRILKIKSVRKRNNVFASLKRKQFKSLALYIQNITFISSIKRRFIELVIFAKKFFSLVRISILLNQRSKFQLLFKYFPNEIFLANCSVYRDTFKLHLLLQIIPNLFKTFLSRQTKKERKKISFNRDWKQSSLRGTARIGWSS